MAIIQFGDEEKTASGEASLLLGMAILVAQRLFSEYVPFLAAAVLPKFRYAHIFKKFLRWLLPFLMCVCVYSVHSTLVWGHACVAQVFPFILTFMLKKSYQVSGSPSVLEIGYIMKIHQKGAS